jgi:CheY-like chemotaxis protein
VGSSLQGRLVARILVVDDDADLRHIAAETLRHVGHEVQEAPDGIEALRIVGRWHPYVVVLDVFMPNMDGLEAVVAIRKAAPHVRIIVMSGGASGPVGSGQATHVIEQALALGAVASLPKPFDGTKLRQLIDEVTRDSAES